MFNTLSLHTFIAKALAKLEITEPTPVQRAAIPPALKHKDLLVSAETGSGKTIAFLLPTLQRLLTHPDPKTGTRALILVPTRELARQIYDHCMALASYTDFTCGLIIGGEDYKKQMLLLRRNPEIIIATPGRIKAQIESGSTFLADLEVLILDEADRMLDMGFSEDVLHIAEHCNPERQTLLYSATLNHQGIRGVAQRILREPEVLTLNTVQDKHGDIKQQVILADNPGHKAQLLRWLLEHEKFDKALIFTNTRALSDSLGQELMSHGHRTGILHGDMEQQQRNQVMDRLRQGNIKVLVATDVAARGLDVEGIDLVVNFEMPRNGHDYVHRIGRTGRAGRKGLAISLISHNEWNIKAGIEKYLRQRFTPRTIKELEGAYHGPDKVKKSGKAAGAPKSKRKADAAKKKKDKVKDKASERHRNKKNIGKRRQPSRPLSSANTGKPPKKT
ncbi:MAG TPA: DEAD/DEAH box helicase [Gammaproteobacteria bacterium]|nr:DEAD/DEAH box helicase [Gammaproteobacteria bacterium]